MLAGPTDIPTLPIFFVGRTMARPLLPSPDIVAPESTSALCNIAASQTLWIHAAKINISATVFEIVSTACSDPQ